MTKDFTEVQEVLANYKTAVLEKDVEKFLTMYAPELHIYDCWMNWESKGIASWKETVTGWFAELRDEGIVLKVDFHDVVIEEGSSLAFVHCAVTYAGHQEGSGEKLRQMTNRFTFGLKKMDSSWLITHEHSSLPINPETGKGIFNSK